MVSLESACDLRNNNNKAQNESAFILWLPILYFYEQTH